MHATIGYAITVEHCHRGDHHVVTHQATMSTAMSMSEAECRVWLPSLTLTLGLGFEIVHTGGLRLPTRLLDPHSPVEQFAIEYARALAEPNVTRQAQTVWMNTSNCARAVQRVHVR
jgi:hypothetical protein